MPYSLEQYTPGRLWTIREYIRQAWRHRDAFINPEPDIPAEGRFHIDSDLSLQYTEKPGQERGLKAAFQKVSEAVDLAIHEEKLGRRLAEREELIAKGKRRHRFLSSFRKE